MEGHCTQQRDAIVEALVLHQGIDPTNGIESAHQLILGTQDQIEAMAWVGQLAFFHPPSHRGGQVIRTQIDGRQRLFAVEVRATMEKLVLNELVKGSYFRTIRKNRHKSKVFAYALG